MNKPGFVVDTNVMISAVIFPTSIPRKALEKAKNDGLLLLSIATGEELKKVLLRKKFDKYVDSATRLEFLEELVEIAQLITVTEAITVCRDPKDDKFLEVAVCGNANCIVSGDDDLHALSPFRDIPIYSRSF